MRAVDRNFDPPIEQIYGAIGRPELWSEVLADITARMKGEHGLIYIHDFKANYIHDFKANRLLFAVGHRLDSKYIALYEENHLAGPLLPRIMPRRAAGASVKTPPGHPSGS
ncbi:MAG TPA: hypothetical protein VFC45_07010 [Pseudolabrys sp.]|nr:hypothetical protein [Pseudolabrys sp.]